MKFPKPSPKTSNMKTIFSSLDMRSFKFVWRISFGIALAIGCLISIFRHVDSLQLLFVFPVVLASWYGTTKSGASLGVISTVIYVLIKLIFERDNTDLIFIAYNGALQLFVWSFLAIIITNFRSVHRIEVNAADTDMLTGVRNRRSLYAELENELHRSRRYGHVFSLAYIDIDDFKNINDTLGHSTGDNVLKVVSRIMNNCLRNIDVVARIGGDEFVCLLPETNQSGAKKAINKTIIMLNKCVKENHWPVTFSVGVVTFTNSPEDVDQAMLVADNLMYTVKNDSKNDIAYAEL